MELVHEVGLLGQIIGQLVGLQSGLCRRVSGARREAAQVASQTAYDLLGHGHDGLQTRSQALAVASLQGLERELQANVGLHHTVMQIEPETLTLALGAVRAQLLELRKAFERGVGQLSNAFKHAPVAPAPSAPARHLQAGLTLLPGQGYADALQPIGWLVQPNCPIARWLAGQVQAAVARLKILLRQLQHAPCTVLQPEVRIDAAQQLADQF
jgi:hypothetical protein